MSRWLAHADAMAAHLDATLPWCAQLPSAKDRIPVIVDRKLEIDSIVRQTVAKARGGCVVILFRGARNPDPKSKLLKMGGNYSIFCMTKPLMKDAVVTADELLEATAEALHGWAPTPITNTLTQSVRVLDAELIPDPRLLIYEITATIIRLKS